jgi:hypothetical protein
VPNKIHYLTETARKNTGRNKDVCIRRERQSQAHSRIIYTQDRGLVLVGTAKGDRPLGKPRHRWEDNIKMDLPNVVFHKQTNKDNFSIQHNYYLIIKQYLLYSTLHVSTPKGNYQSRINKKAVNCFPFDLP